MLQVIIFMVLSMTASSNALSACTNDDAVLQDVCPGNAGRELVRDGRLYDNQIIEFLNVTLRELLQNISSNGDLPVLDPLTIGNISNITLGEGDNPLKLDLADVTVENLLDYMPYNGSYEILGFKIPIAIDFPIITLKGEYEMEGWIGNELLYLYGSGGLTFSLLNVSLYVELDMGTTSESYLFLECIAIDFSVGGAESNLDNLLGGGDLGDTLNLILADAVPTLLDLVKDRLIGSIVCPLKNVANNFLQTQELTLSDLLCFIGVQFAC